jgi:hypothetical protein
MTVFLPKKHVFQFGLLLFLVMGLSAGIVLATSKGTYDNPKASDKEVILEASPSPSPTATPRLYTK